MLVVITTEKTLEEEASLLTEMFEEGMSLLHLRKPGFTKTEFEETLKKIPPKYYRKIVIHSHFELITKYNLAGIHFTNKFLAKAKDYNIAGMYKAVKSKGLTVSSSLHTLEELSKLDFYYDYVFLSPVFDSISKQNYLAKADHFKDLKNYKPDRTKVLALGGITPENIEMALQMGFDGVGVLGTIWTAEDPIKQLIAVRETMTRLNS